MTVKELIEKLKEQDQDAMIVMDHLDVGEAYKVLRIAGRKMYYNSDEDVYYSEPANEEEVREFEKEVNVVVFLPGK